MIEITIPANNIEERKYILNVIIYEFLGLEYNLVINENEKNWNIKLENGKKLVVEDHFFNKYKDNLEYLKFEALPKKVEFTNNQFTIEGDIPIIYGTSAPIKITKLSITCPIDIFASSFLMLTRWEEYVNKKRDNHNRFPASESLAFKNNFLDRPVVNEYVEMLWNMLKFLGCKQERVKRDFQFLLTHDVDIAFGFKNYHVMFRLLAGDIIKRRNLRNFAEDLRIFMFGKDPFDTYDYLMDVSEKLGTRSYFFLHSSSSSKFDVNNDKFLNKVSEKIKSRGHFIGYHPSYNSYNNIELFLKEKKKVESIIGQRLTFGRQHYLRFEIPSTWQVWEDANMEWDSTLSYVDKEGFRCGVCYPYSVFNILTRKKLKLKERPLIVMERSFIDYQNNISPEQMEEKIKKLIGKTKKI